MKEGESMSDGKITICRKCGDISDEKINCVEFLGGKGKNICRFCGGEAESIDITFAEARIKYGPVIEERYGVVPSNENNIFERYRDKIIREEYYYGKLDTQTDEKAVEERKRFEEEMYNDVYTENPLEKIKKETEELHKKNESSIPKCPSCGSTDLQKLSAVGKVARVKMFGILGAGNLGKTYKCRRCGVKF